MDATTTCRWQVFLTVVMALTLGAFATSPALADVNGCPTGNFANRQTSNRVGATATVSGNTVSYTFESFANEGSGGVPGLIEYCVYSGTKPDSVTTVATGANGSAWEDPQQFDNFSFQRRNGNPSNIPYDGASHAMGSATWMRGGPGNFDIILLHINDAVECNNLYGGNPGTCFVRPGSLAFLPKPPTATKKANPSFENAFSWTIDKSVDNKIIKTSTTGTFNYTVTVTHDSGTAEGWQVNGTITITNPNPIGDDITGATVTDAVDNGGTCTVTGGSGVAVPAGGSVTLNYNCTYPSAPSPSSGTNTATVTWPDQTWGLPAGSTTATATFNFGAVTPGLLNECVDVSDTYPAPGAVLGKVCVGDPNPTTFTYSRIVSSDPGTCTTVTNTATFTTNDTGTTGSDTASAMVCVGADLTVEKTATPSFKRTYNWDISKSVDKTEIDNSGGPATFNYTVKVDETGFTDSYWQVTGTIKVTNPNSWEDITGVTVTDAVDNGGTCTVTGGTGVTVPAGDSITLDYKCTYASAPSSSSGKNSATATWDAGAFFTPHGSASGSADFAFTTPPTTVNKTVTVTDTAGGPLGALTATDSTPFASKEFTYPRTVTGIPGTCKSFDNTATIVETGQSSSHSVKVCVGKDLTVSKTATASFDSSVTKSVDKALVEQIGGTATFNYTAIVTESNWKVSGNITVNNPNDWEAITANLADAVSNGGTCSVTPATVTVPASSSATASYTCTYASAPSSASGTNTATATWNSSAYFTPNGSGSGSKGFGFGSLTVTDTFCQDPNMSCVTTTLGSITVPAASTTYTYSRTVNVPTFNCVKYTNTAKIVETGQTASQTIEVCGPAKTGALTMGFWQNKNGQGIITGGASTSGVCNSGTWLRQYAPFQDLSATATCNQVATYVTNIIKAANASGPSMNVMLKSQMLATALDVYFSDPALGGNKIGAPAPIGGVAIDLTKICANISSCSTFINASGAFGGATTLTISQALAYAASQSNIGGGTWYGNVKSIQEQAKDVFDAINNQVAFAP